MAIATAKAAAKATATAPAKAKVPARAAAKATVKATAPVETPATKQRTAIKPHMTFVHPEASADRQYENAVNPMTATAIPLFHSGNGNRSKALSAAPTPPDTAHT